MVVIVPAIVVRILLLPHSLRYDPNWALKSRTFICSPTPIQSRLKNPCKPPAESASGLPDEGSLCLVQILAGRGDHCTMRRLRLYGGFVPMKRPTHIHSAIYRGITTWNEYRNVTTDEDTNQPGLLSNL